jgi:hypothetical protein
LQVLILVQNLENLWFGILVKERPKISEAPALGSFLFVGGKNQKQRIVGSNYFKSLKQLSGFMKDPTGTWVITRVPVNVKRVFDFAYNLGSKVSQNDQVSVKNRRFY